jgi:putative selenate reductase molybdopterin-binding subunit
MRPSRTAEPSVRLRVNGADRTVPVTDRTSLLTVLRDRLGLTGTKQGCYRGQCGACTVLVDGSPRYACLTLAALCKGREVRTVEGLAGADGALAPLQRAFLDHHGFQCGFCTPGMLMSATALLEKGVPVTAGTVADALSGNVCRCGNYPAIAACVLAAAGATDTAAQPPALVDDRPIVTGAARFTGDHRRPGQLHAKVLRSPYAHARFRIDPGRALRHPGVVAVVTHDDVPAYATDRPFLTDRARYVGDAVAAVAAVDLPTAEAALALLDVEWEPLPAVRTTAQARVAGAPQLHDGGNVAAAADGATHRDRWGDDEATFAGADLVLTASYATPFQCHAHIEPHCCLAEWDGDKLTVWNSVQHPFSNQRVLAEIFGRPVSDVRVHCEHLGGGYGGKDSDDLTKSHEDAIAALLARRTGAPVRLALTHRENLTATSGRNPCEITLSVAAGRSGQLLGVRATVEQDTGAYADNGPRVLQVMATVLASSYRWRSFRFEGASVHTNSAVGGEIWGFGSPQITFALEQHVDAVARELGLDPAALRTANLPRGGDPMPGPLGRHLRYRQARGEACVEEALAAAGAAPTGGDRPGLRHGRGLRVSPENSGHDVSNGVVALDRQGRLHIPVGVGNMGTRSHEAIARMVHEVLPVDPARIRLTWGDSATTAWDFGGDSSRAVHCTGQAFVNAAYDLRDRLLRTAARLLGTTAERLVIDGSAIRSADAAVPLEEVVRHVPPAGADREPWFGGASGGPRARAWGRDVRLDDHTRRLAEDLPGIVGIGFGVRQFTRVPWAAQIADVEVDRRTGEVRLANLVTATDVGRVVSPASATAQIRGAGTFAAGWALRERFLADPVTGVPLTVELRELGVTTFPRAPEVTARFLTGEAAEPSLGLGETGVQAAAAIAIAVSRALGRPVTSLPLRPEDVADDR